MKFYFFKSSRKSDKCSQVTIITSSVRRAYALAVVKFKEYGYKGTPKRLMIA